MAWSSFGMLAADSMVVYPVTLTDRVNRHANQERLRSGRVIQFSPHNQAHELVAPGPEEHAQL